MEIVKKKVREYREVCVLNEIREESCELIIPDTSPDFESLICAFAVCTLNEKSLLSGNVRTGGTIDTVIYYDAAGSENGYSLVSSFPFGQSYELNSCLPDDKLIFSLDVVSAACEMINSRKVRVKVKVLASAQVLRAEERCICEDIDSDSTDGVNVLTTDIEQTACNDVAVKQISFTEEIRLVDDGFSGDSRIVRWESRWQKSETKIMENKVMLRGTVELKVFSAGSDFKTIDKHSYTLPFSQVIDCNVREGDDTDILLSQNKCNVKIENREDDTAYLVCDMGSVAAVKVYRKIPSGILSDAYSTEYESDIVKETISLYGGQDAFKDECELEGRLEIDDEVASVCDCSVRSAVAGSKVEHYANVVYENAAGTVRCASVVLCTSVELPGDIIGASCFASAERVNVRTDAGGTVVSLNSVVTGKVRRTQSFEQICDFKLDKTRLRRRHCKGNLILKNVGRNESAWSIAKDYGTTKGAILAANDMYSEEDVSEGKLILIPFVK